MTASQMPELPDPAEVRAREAESAGEPAAPPLADADLQAPPPSLPAEEAHRADANQASERTRELAEALLQAGLSIAVAESLTGGGLAAELVRVPGISASFRGGIVAYHNTIKHTLLGVDRELLLDRGAVDPEVALQMARGARRAFAIGEHGVDIAVSTTGVAGPDPADGRAAGTVYVGLSTLWGEKSVELDFRSLVRADDPVGSRQRIRFATIEAAMFNLLEHLAEQER